MTTDRRDGDRGPHSSDEPEAESGSACTFGTLFERAPPGVTAGAVRSALAAVRSGGEE
jgi:hypothetical protein